MSAQQEATQKDSTQKDSTQKDPTQSGFAGFAAGRPFTVYDLEAIPDDGYRYELIDGALIVTPAPSWQHQESSGELFVQLRNACTPEFRVLSAPFAVRTSIHNELQPDILVARYVDLTLKDLPVAPVLAVEVLSESTALNDLNTKKAAYERMGAASYWVIDPEPPGGLTVFELTAQGRYREVASISGDEKFATDRPFPITVVPARLLDGLRPLTE
ncbi:MAG: Uma2 family endonuclease [Pseudonocardiales bacterium]|nr:Uma2 family endonuclease [Pseudonocardiales bacterium]